MGNLYIASIFHMSTMSSKVIVSKSSQWDLLYSVASYLGSPYLNNLGDLYDYVEEHNRKHTSQAQIFVTVEKIFV